jgi:membrane-bound serine protease (ClpP class)
VGRLAKALCRLATAVLTIGGALVVATSPAAATRQAPDPACARHGCVDVVAVNGLIDEIEADLIVDTVGGATPGRGIVAVVLQVDSGGVAVGDGRLDEVATAIRDSSVPVSIWIGPSGSSALGGVVDLVAVADSSGISPGSDIGDAGPQRLDPAEFGELLTGRSAVARTDVLSGREAVDAGVVDRFSPTIGDHIVNLDGVETRTTTEDGQRRQIPESTVRFSKLPLLTQLFHTVASPSVAYLLLVVGLGLLLFEFFTAGVGIAGVAGAVSVALAAYGTAALPHNNWALALVVASFVAFAIDVQSGIPRFWSVVGMVAFIVGSGFLFVEFRPTWLALVAGVVGIAVSMFSGMPSMVRTRFATPTIGREWMIGKMGSAVSAVDPEGTVRVDGGLWQGRTNRATPIPVGDPVRVVAIDGLVLEVEPEEGGAKDYREMRSRRRAGDGDDPGPEA